MPSAYTPVLKLALFNPSEDGWAAAMNANIRRLDSELDSVVRQVDGRINVVEAQIAARYVDLQESLSLQTTEYLSRVNRAREETYDQLRTYFETVLSPTMVQFLTDVNTIIASTNTQIASSEATREDTEQSVTDMFALINSRFNTIDARIDTESQYVDSNKEALETQLNAASVAIDDHANRRDNPHVVTGSQLGALGTVIIYQSHPNDAEFL